MFHPLILNVRGEKFLLNTRTLRKCPGANDLSIFLCMDLPRSGELFLDRDPKLFGQIVFYLQDGRLNIRYDEHLLALLQQEAEYYGLHHLAARLRNLQPFDGELTIVANKELDPSEVAVAEEGIATPSGSSGSDEEFVFETRASHVLGKRRWWECYLDGPDWLDYGCRRTGFCGNKYLLYK
ncbi:unnamed protein product [Cylicocyclus nassatus]|uniref:Potassium channel tetramerisation-type BTB domain-containing protein n=1 Tax=Cylicocyclus nassatus TaxID=53992 RepID=A0AA36DVL3_CYLNA|nr:unnamed protein product [Cylicocyclus nassatus]